MGGSLVGRKADEVRRWAAWYLAARKLAGVTVDQLLQAALKEQGTTPVVTKTKLRRAVARLLREARLPDQTTRQAG